MKKLSIICGLTLLMALVSAPVFAMSFQMDLDQASPLDYETEVTLDVSADVQIDIWLTAYEPTEAGELKSVDYYFYWDTDQLSYVDAYVQDAGDWPSVATQVKTAPGGLLLGVLNSAGPFYPSEGIDGKSVMLHTIELHCEAAGDGTIEVSLDNQGEGPAGAVYDKDGWDYYPADLAATVHQVTPECGCDLAADGDGEVNDGDNSEHYTVTPVNDAYCNTPHVYVYSDDCTGGDVDPSTGVFTAPIPIDPSGETCTITVTDSANPGVSCEAPIELVGTPPCNIWVYEGALDCDDYSKPGRRQLYLTCGDVVDFNFCSDCEQEGGVPCEEGDNVTWSMTVISGTPPAGTSIDPVTGVLTIGPDCTDLDAPVVVEVKVECDQGVSTIDGTVTIDIGEVIVSVEDQTVSNDVDSVVATVALSNPNNKVKAMEISLEDDPDCLVCTGCQADPDRALEYTCSASEQIDGRCLVVLATFNPAGMIEEGDGAVATVEYVSSCDPDACMTIREGSTAKLADQFGDPLCACFDEGEICYAGCGDVYPRECLPDDPVCGDGVTDIFDILEVIDIILNIVEPSDCQAARADVPTGTPPYCGCIGEDDCQVDGVIDIFDLLVIIDMALGKPNCCDYCATGAIY
jgi:hypothetical protein